MTIVGITQRSLPPTQFGERRYGLDARWFDFFAACRLLPVPLPNDAEHAGRAARGLRLAGLVFSGGDDLAEYGGASPDRDVTESTLLDWAVARRIPVAGVCRGMQVIMRFFGAHLVAVEGHVATHHMVQQDDGERVVNSFHRMGARSVPRPLRVTSRSAGVVESVRHEQLPLMGTMWHPEREAPFDPLDVESFLSLFGGGAGDE
jgi:gamma-glutamyl-gamma-aminobutyrate hydrolase PuuD